jgi:transcriptional regulator with XRE-family HTH domain
VARPPGVSHGSRDLHRLCRRTRLGRSFPTIVARLGVVAERMGISVARVSQIEKGDVSTREVLDRYVAALGGVLKLVADFGDEQLKVS